jgi:hypothetical protein
MDWEEVCLESAPKWNLGVTTSAPNGTGKLSKAPTRLPPEASLLQWTGQVSDWLDRLKMAPESY